MPTNIYTERHGEKILCGSITPSYVQEEFNVLTRENITKHEAVSAFGGSISFYTFGAAEFWLKTRAQVRS